MVNQQAATSLATNKRVATAVATAVDDAAPIERPMPEVADPKVRLVDFGFSYGSNRVLKQLNVAFESRKVTALIGPSGCGKTTLLRSFNRMHDLYPGNRYEGRILLLPEGVDLVGPDISPIEVRMRLSMVFQKPNPFPKSIFDNVAFGLRMRGMRDKAAMRDKVEEALRLAALWARSLANPRAARGFA